MATTKKKLSAPRTTALVKRPAQDLATAQVPPDQVALMFERLAKDPKVDVAKLERLIALQERILAHNAKAAFTSAFALMQAEIPEIDEKGRIVVSGTVQSRYAKNEDIQRVLRPILAKHGFSLGFRTEWPDGLIEVVGELSHIGGHARESRFRAKADTSGNKNDTQALGSTVSYGHRYATKDLLNITSRGEDTDGQQSSRRREPAPIDHAKADEPISDGQRKRLFVLIKQAGREQEDVKVWLWVRYGIDSTRKILRKDYDAICTAVEAPGALPAREPGEDDA